MPTETVPNLNTTIMPILNQLRSLNLKGQKQSEDAETALMAVLYSGSDTKYNVLLKLSHAQNMLSELAETITARQTKTQILTYITTVGNLRTELSRLQEDAFPIGKKPRDWGRSPIPTPHNFTTILAWVVVFVILGAIFFFLR